MPTFGDTGTGGSASVASTQAYYMRVQMGAIGGSCTSISWYLSSSAGSNVKFAIYADSGTAPTTVLGSTASTAINTTTEFKTISLSSPVAVTGSAWYWLAVRAETATTSAYYGAGTSLNAGRVTVVYASFPGASPTFETSYTVRGYHVYATYTETAAGIANRVISLNQSVSRAATH